MREKRAFDELRPLRVQTDYLDFADGSAYIEIGQTKVIAGATIEEKAPPFLKGQGTGWVTAEYAMLPCSTERRSQRERFPGRISGRTQEIQRLIGRSLRAVTDMAALGERTIIIDCDVIQADGGTRVAAVTAGCVAAAMAMKKLLDRDIIDKMPLQHLVAGISVGIVDGRELLDLDYAEDSQASTDMNVIETDSGQLVEVQATAEKAPFSRKDLSSLLRLADKAIQEIIQVQKAALKKKSLLFMAYGR
jgi:ribonuclease PH